MEISAVIISPQAMEAMFAPRPIDTHALPTAQAGSPSVVTVNAQAVDASDFASVIDKLRVDFAQFRQRLTHAGGASATPASGSAINNQAAAAAGGNPLAEMQRVMAWSLRTQTDMLQMAVGFHAALSATQQSQNGVKTLVEKV